MFSRMRVPARLLVIAAAIVVLTAFVSSVSASSSQSRALHAAKAFHATKDCSGNSGLPGNFCTIRSSNVKAIKENSKIFYLEPRGHTKVDSDVVLFVERGTMATGHCKLVFATAHGLCTFSHGTGKLAGFQARVRVTPDSTIPNLWHWDGTYTFTR